MPGLVIDGFFAIVAPRARRPTIVARLNRDIDQYLGGPEIQGRLLALGLATAAAARRKAPAGDPQKQAHGARSARN